MGTSLNIVVKANVHSVNLNRGKGVSNWILFPWAVEDGAAVFGYCQEMMSLPGRLGILDSREDVHKRLVVGVDGKINAF